MRIRDRIKELRRVPAGDLLPHPKNWRKHPQAQHDAMRGVLAAVGYADAVLARETPEGLQLVDGHLRAEVTPDAEIPVLVLDVTEAEAELILATHDPLAGMAEANQQALGELLSSVEADGAVEDMLKELAAENDIDLFASGAEEEPPEAQIDRADELQKKWKVKPGQLWGIEGEQSHRLVCGDSTKAEDVGRVMGGASTSLIMTSPPYNQNIDGFKPSGMHKEGDWVAKVGRLAYSDSMPEADYQAWQSQCLQLWHDKLKDGGSVFYNHKNRYRDKQVISPLEWLPGPFRLRQEIIWSRPGSVTQNARMFLPSDERIYWLYKGDDFVFDDTTEHKSWSTVWKIGLETNKDHAVGFPVELPSRCIAAASRQGESVLDPFLGSGTTMVAAEQLKRRCFGIEIAEKYCAVILQRMTDMGCKCKVQK